MHNYETVIPRPSLTDAHPAPITTRDECDVCGAAVVDMTKHAAWHAQWADLGPARVHQTGENDE